MRALPPFDSLIAFDAALRRRSMTLAASELGLTQSAISHRLRKLEAFMGAPLLRRSSSGLSATPVGEALAEGLTTLLDDMSELRARSRAALRPMTLRVGAGAALADNWLVRRLPRFSVAHPGIAVELVMVASETEIRSSDLDIQVHWMPTADARSSSTKRILFKERVFPVCAPQLLPQGRTLTDPAELARLPVVHKGPADAASGAEWSWATWFERLGIAGSPPQGLRLDTLGTALAAALQGAGVVLARSLVVHDALAERRLCRVLPPSWDMPSSKAHMVRWPAALAGDERVKAFVSWLVAEANATSQG